MVLAVSIVLALILFLLCGWPRRFDRLNAYKGCTARPKNDELGLKKKHDSGNAVQCARQLIYLVMEGAWGQQDPRAIKKTPLASPLPSVVTYHSLEYVEIHTNVRPGRPEAGFRLHMNRRSRSRSSLRGRLALANKSTTSTVLDVRRVQAEPYHYLRRPHSRSAGPQAVTPLAPGGLELLLLFADRRIRGSSSIFVPEYCICRFQIASLARCVVNPRRDRGPRRRPVPRPRNRAAENPGSFLSPISIDKQPRGRREGERDGLYLARQKEGSQGSGVACTLYFQCPFRGPPCPPPTAFVRFRETEPRRGNRRPFSRRRSHKRGERPCQRLCRRSPAQRETRSLIVSLP
ncbi:uncharacterized protein BDZ83DRAFT_78928 [Colletotrichum acutatum]|uniref:Uncharacterized protein n=1 Tax=Glomerella acutata TaxID=27357 RepID=A0AAD8UDX5_GLOAC|nr:uncharacterized protein BDZ83DRAFT_78928 [Colletotrichum acutatum]KAK1713740.1 hypothetical protein BDZ83DRAFT_78928 [Colletotrichum acutatum]